MRRTAPVLSLAEGQTGGKVNGSVMPDAVVLRLFAGKMPV